MSVAPQPLPTSSSGVSPTVTTTKTGFPLAWLAIGALGSLLLVVVILLALQLRKPAATNIPPQSTSQGSHVNAPPTSPPPGSSSESTGTKPEDKPQDQTGTQLGKGGETAGNSSSRKDKEQSSRDANQPPPKNKPPVTPPHVDPKPPVDQQLPPSQPETFDSLLVKGDVAQLQGHYEDALAFYKKAYLRNSTNPGVKRKIVTVLTLLNRPEEAAKYK